MNVLISGTVYDMTWFIGLFVLALAIAVLSKSLIANIGLIICCVVGFSFASTLAGVPNEVRIGVAVIYILVLVFSVSQMLTRVESL